MPQTPHIEKHFTASDFVRDIVIGISDGLTVPFALAAGLSGAVQSTGIIVIAGLAEMAAGAVSMGLGGYLAARSDAEHYESELKRERSETRELPDVEKKEVWDILERYGVGTETSRTAVEEMARRPSAWIDFMMRFELGLERPEPRRALVSGITIGGSYAAGGLIPLLPYMVARSVEQGLVYSVIATALALVIFGYVKGRFVGVHPLRGAFRTLIIGGLAAGIAFLIARMIS